MPRQGTWRVLVFEAKGQGLGLDHDPVSFREYGTPQTSAPRISHPLFPGADGRTVHTSGYLIKAPSIKRAG